jgi:hypothetical protein
MANKAFTRLSGIEGGIYWEATLVEPDDTISASTTGQLISTLPYDYTREDIRAVITAAVRTYFSDDTIHVEFVF